MLRPIAGVGAHPDGDTWCMTMTPSTMTPPTGDRPDRSAATAA